MRAAEHSSRILAGILILGFVLRLVAAFYVQHRVDAAAIPGKICLIDGDATGYWELARKIVTGQEYVIYQPPRYVLRTPGVPVLLAVGMKLWGENLLAMRCLLALVGTAGCGFVFLLGAELFNRRVGLWSAALVAVSPPMVMFSVLILSEIPFATTLAASLWLMARLARRNTRLRWNAQPTAQEAAPPVVGGSQFGLAFAAGVMAGVATLVRPTWLLIAPGFVVLFVLFAQTRGRALVQAVVLLAGLAISLAPWTWRNYRVTGHFIPTTLWVGASLYDGLHPKATGSSDMKFVESDGIYARLSEYDADQHYRKAAWKFVREQPGRTAELAVIKLGRFWSPWPNAEQFGNWAAGAVLASAFLTACVLAAIGLWSTRRHIWGWLIPCVPLLYFSAVHTLFVGSIRYRLPAEGPLFVLSAVGLLVCVNKFASPSSLSN